MRYEVSLLPFAEEEIGEAFRWYSERSPSAANGFDSLAEDPTMWPADDEGVRYYILRRVPYTIHYEIADTSVTVLAVAHQRRRPGYWQER